MRKHGKLAGLALVLAAILSFAGVINAERIVSVHTSPQLILNQLIHDGIDGASFPSSTVDLAGGDHRICDFQVHTTSGVTSGSPTLDLTIQISADGGSNWATAGTFTQITTTNAVVNAQKTGIIVAPGTKMRVIPALSAGTTFYELKVWAMPRSNE